MPTQDRAVLSESLYTEVAEAALQRATSIHTQLPPAIQACAILRWFDVELLAAFLSSDTATPFPAEEFLRHLHALRLVQPHPTTSGRWLLLPELRAALLARPWAQEQWLTLHARAAAAFGLRLESYPISGDARFRDTGWRDLVVEWTYHLLHQDPIAGWHRVQLTCAQAFAIPTSGARWEVDFCVQFLGGLAWPPGIDELDENITTLKAAFADLAAYRDSQALPVVEDLANVPGLTSLEESGIRAWAGGVYLRNVGNLAAAITWLQQAATLAPQDVDVQFDLAEAYRMPGIWAGRFDLAEQHARQALAVAPTSDSGYLGMGYLAQAVEDWDAADGWFRQAIAVKPDVIDGYLALSEVAAARRDVVAALTYIDAALAVNPGIRYYALIRRGHAYRDAGRVAEGVREYELARQDAPERPDAYVALGDASASQGRFQEAEAWYQQALTASSTDSEALIALATLYHEDEPQRATAMLEQALRSGVRSKDIYYTLSNFYRTSGEITEVARIQQALMRLDGEEAYSGDCTIARALLDEAWRQPAGDARTSLLERAAGSFVSAQARDARRAWAYVGLAEVAVLRDTPHDVEENLRQLHERAPWAEYDGLVAIGQAYKDHLAAAAAGSYLQRAVALQPDRPAAWQALADLYDWQGDPAGVAQAWAQVVRVDPAQAYAGHVAVGDAYQRAGDDQRARAEYASAVSLGPDQAAAVRSLAELDDLAGHAREAMAGYARVADLSPNLSGLAHSRIANLLLREGDHAGAEGAARAAVAANPYQLAGYVELARVGVALARDDLTTEARGALLAATGDRLAYDFDFAVGEALREAGLWDKARAQYAACMAKDQSRVDAFVGTGLAWLAEGKYPSARRMLEQALALDSTRVDVHVALSRLHSAQNNLPGVFEAQAQIVALQPGLRYDAHLATAEACEAARQYQQAQAQYEAAIQLAPRRPDAYASLAILLRRANQPQAAEQAYRQARELAGIAYPDLAWYYQQQERLADAEWVYRLAIREEPTEGDAYTGLVDLLAMQERVDEANDVLDRMASQPELAGDERLARARLLAWQKREDAAIDVYRDAIHRFPQRVEAYQELVRLYLDRGDVEGAIDILRQGHVAQPAEASFAWILAQLAQQAGWYEEARRWYLKAGKLDANDADAAGAYVRAADIALRQNRRRAALLALQQAVQRDPHNAQAYFLLGELRERQHKLLEAAQAYTQATTLAPKFGEAYRARGRIYGRLSDLQSLDTMTQEVLALNPNEAYEATIIVADTFRQASEYRRAEEAYRQAIHLRPEQPDAQLALASLLEQRQRLAESAALYQQAATRLDDPQAAANAWGQAGRLLVQMTQYAAAMTAFTAARTADPENAGWHEALGDLYERSGNLEQAATSYDRARALNPNNSEIYVALARVARAQNNPRRLAWIVRHIRALNLNAASEYNRLLLIAAVYQAADDSPRAVTAYQNAIAAYPREPDAYWELIRSWIDQEQLDDALTVASSMSKQPGLTAAAWLATGNVQMQRSDLVAAEEAFRHAVTAQPASPEAYLELARLYDTHERPAEAVEILRQGLKALPHDVHLLAALAERLSAQGQRNDAIGLLQRAARWAREPADVADIHWRIGDLWLQEGYADRAEQAWRRALAQNPDHANAYWSLGQLRERVGQLDDALALYTRATEVAPKYREAYAARGRILASRGDLSGITRMAEELAALYLDPSETYQAHLLLAGIYVDAGHYEAAARELNVAITLDTSNPEAHIQLGWVYEVQQQWSKARAEYERVSQLVPDLQRNVALRSGQLYVNEGNLDAAIQAFLEGIELAPAEPDGYLSLARLYENQGRWHEARATYAQMLPRGPDMASLAHQALGTLAERQGDITRAEDEYQQALAIAPQDPSAHLLLANFYEATSQWDKAVAAYQRAAELDPSQATNPLLFAADIQRQLGQKDELQVTCNRVVALVDAMPSPDYHALRQRGLAYAMQGDFVQAEQGLRRALAANPDDLQAHLYLAATLTVLQRGDEADQHLAVGLRLAQRKADLVYALREAAVVAAHQPPVPGASALLERMQAARERLP